MHQNKKQIQRWDNGEKNNSQDLVFTRYTTIKENRVNNNREKQ